MKEKVVNQEEEKKLEAEPAVNPNLLVLEKESEIPYNEVVEAERKNIFTVYRRTSKLNNILMIVVVVIFAAAFLLFAQKDLWMKILGGALAGVTFIGMLIYYFRTRNVYPNTSKKYFYTFWKSTNEYLFNQEGFDKCQIDLVEKYELADVVADRVYKDITASASRNIVRGEYKGQSFAFGELAFYRPGPKKHTRDVVFVGRHLSLDNKMHFEGRYIINIRGDKDLDLPTDIEDLKELVNQNRFVIYGPEGAKVEKDLGKDFIEACKDLEARGPLVNINIVLWAGKSACYLSYDDSIVAIPFDKEINVDSYAHLKKDIKEVFALLAGK